MASASKAASTSTPYENPCGPDVKNAHHSMRHRIGDSEIIIPTPNACNELKINVASDRNGDNSESNGEHSKDRGYAKSYLSTLFAFAYMHARHAIRHGIARSEMIPIPNECKDSKINRGSDRSGDISESNGEYNHDIVKKISTLFAVSHGAIFSGVASLGALGISSQVRKTMLLVSTLASTAIIGAFVVKSFQEFRGLRGRQRSLRNSPVAKWCWVTERIALFLMFAMLSLCLFLVSDWVLKPRHH